MLLAQIQEESLKLDALRKAGNVVVPRETEQAEIEQSVLRVALELDDIDEAVIVHPRPKLTRKNAQDITPWLQNMSVEFQEWYAEAQKSDAKLAKAAKDRADEDDVEVLMMFN